MALKKKEGIQTIYICENCDNELFRFSPKDKDLTTIDASMEKVEEIRERFDHSEGIYRCKCGAKHRVIYSKEKGKPLMIELGHMIK